MTAPPDMAPTDSAAPNVHTLLTQGRLEIAGRLTDASNVTLLGRLELDGATLHCIYKPIRGERPLWDFPSGTLAYREFAAYRLSEVAGWHCVPMTVLRPGPFGDGMVQEWIGPAPDLVLELAEPDDVEDAEDGADSEIGDGAEDLDDDSDDEYLELDDEYLIDPVVDDAGDPARTSDEVTPLPADLVVLVPSTEVPAGWLPVFRALDNDGTVLAVCHADDPRLAVIAGFDAVVNNADRKAPHLLTTADERILGVDHGLTFHVEDKLRTILWGWAGRPLPAAVLDGLRRLKRWIAEPDDELGTLLTRSELRELARRIDRLLAERVFPDPPQDRTPIPWPPL